MTQVALTAVSSNRKTGAIPTSTTEKASCPSTCPFLQKGCYAKGGPQNIHWSAISRGERGVTWSEFTSAIRKLKRGQLWRHNVSGDLPHSDGVIDSAKVASLVDANRGRKGYTPTPTTFLTPRTLKFCRMLTLAGSQSMLVVSLWSRQMLLCLSTTFQQLLLSTPKNPVDSLQQPPVVKLSFVPLRFMTTYPVRIVGSAVMLTVPQLLHSPLMELQRKLLIRL